MNMELKKHVVITGTGRAGTTFLVELLTLLGLDTGYKPENLAKRKNATARAGLEYDLRRGNCPFVVKSPEFCDYAEDVIFRKDIVIEHVFVPMRNLSAAAESRRYVSKTVAGDLPLATRLKRMIRPTGVAGGLWHTRSKRSGAQEDILLRTLYKLLLALSGTSIPITLMRYPRIVQDCDYLFKKLTPVLRGIKVESFRTVFNKVARPGLVHRFNENDR